MEEKYPIKFSLGQFIILLGIQLIVMALVFLLGARFGGNVFPNFYAKKFQTESPYQGLMPEKTGDERDLAAKSDKLVDTLEVEEGEEEEDSDIPHYRVGADGVSRPVEDDRFEDEEVEPEPLRINNPPPISSGDKNTVVRFKSSGHSKFSVAVGEYFDELIATKKISSLKKKGYEAFLVINKSGSGSPSYGVRIGIFSDRKLAEDFAAEVSNKQGMELRVVHMD